MAEKVGQPVSYVDDLHHHTAKYLFDFQFTLDVFVHKDCVSVEGTVVSTTYDHQTVSSS